MSDDIQRKILNEITDERIRQDAKWGPQYHNDSIWGMILMEEVGEVAQSVVDSMLDEKQHLANIKKELIQVAAVAVAWLECIEKKK